MMQDLTGMPAVGERIDTGSVALGLPEFVVLAAGEYAGQVELLVETTESVTGCPRCGVVATLHDRKPCWVRDLPVGGRPVVLVWFKRVWRCVEPACGQRTWSERTVAIRARSVLTERARVECARRVGQDATDVARVATDLGVGWGTVMRAVWEYGQKVLDGQWLHTNVTVLGLDETAFLKATAASSTQYLTGMVDLRPAGGGPARLLDVVPGRSGTVVTDWLDERGPHWGTRVQVAALDPFRGYERALRAGLPATVVLDSFHAVRLAQRAIDDVRRRVQQETLGHRGRKHDPLYRIRRMLLRGAENLTLKAYSRLLAGLDAGDPDGRTSARRTSPAKSFAISTQPATWTRPGVGCTPSTRPARCRASPSSNASAAPSRHGSHSCWPTSPPAECPTGRPRR
jgi:transposase